MTLENQRTLKKMKKNLKLPPSRLIWTPMKSSSL